MSTQGSTGPEDRQSLPVKPPPPGLSVVAPCSVVPPPGLPGGQAAAAGVLASLGASSSGQPSGPP
eukprot:1721020-Lingulodinium_polyedra.AAC.1